MYYYFPFKKENFRDVKAFTSAHNKKLVDNK